MNITKAHGLLGNSNEDADRRTAANLGWIIARGKLPPCVHCAKAKAKQKSICKASESHKAVEPGKRIYLDLSKVTMSRNNGSDFELK